MIYDLADFMIIVFFYQGRMPFDGKVHFLKEVFDILIGRRKHAARAHVHPIALRAAVPCAVNDFEHKRLECLVLIGRVVLLFPVW